MNPRQIVSSAFASALALGLVGGAGAMTAQDDKNAEKCYGVAKAGQNECASLSGSHGCAGTSKADNLPEDWKMVPKGSCKTLKGMTEAEAKAKVKAKK